MIVFSVHPMKWNEVTMTVECAAAQLRNASDKITFMLTNMESLCDSSYPRLPLGTRGYTYI